MSGQYSILEVTLIGGLGGAFGDLFLFRFLKDKVFGELEPLLLQFNGSKLGHLFQTPYFAWLVPVLGAIIIASPFPDELGVALLGASQLKNWQFFLLTFALDVLGILAIISIIKIA